MTELLVVGCGEHATETLVPGVVSLGRARIVGFCDSQMPRAEGMRSRFGVPHAGADPHRMIDDLRPDAVMLAGPPHMHVDVGLHALEAGCHVLVEKPPAVSTVGLQKLAAAAEGAGLTGMVAHNLRHTAAWQRMIERIQLADVTSMVVTYHASGPTGERWGLTAHEAFLLTHGVHVFDLFNAVLGPANATAHHLNDVGEGRFVLSTQWHAPSGTAGSAVVSTCAPRFNWLVQLSTNEGTLIDISSPRDLTLQEPRSHGAWSLGRRDTWTARSLDAGFESAGYGTEIAHFLDCLAGSATAAPSLSDEIAVYQALDDLYRQTGLPRRLAGG